MMADVFSKTKRSKVMSQIRSSGNKDTELALIRIFRTNQMTGWRRNHNLEGKPDFVFPKDRLALFVDGCFWHGCPAHSRPPKSNQLYWREKLLRNKRRDLLVGRRLRKQGWRVLRIWEHELVLKNLTRLIKRILRERTR